MKLRNVTVGAVIAMLALGGATALPAVISSPRGAIITIMKQPVKVRPNSRFSISGFVGSRPVNPYGGTVACTAISGHGRRPTVAVKEDNFKAFDGRVWAGDGKVVQYRLTFKLAGWQIEPVKTDVIQVSK